MNAGEWEAISWRGAFPNKLQKDPSNDRRKERNSDKLRTKTSCCKRLIVEHRRVTQIINQACLGRFDKDEEKYIKIVTYIYVMV